MIVVARALARRDFSVQHADWRVDGRFTRVGAIGLALSAAFLLFAAQSGLVQYHAHRAERALDRWKSDRRDDTARHEAETQLNATLALGLFPDVAAHDGLASSSCTRRAREGAPAPAARGRDQRSVHA